MPEQPQVTVNATAPTSSGKGYRTQANLESAYANSPIYNGDLSYDNLRENFQSLVLDGDVVGGHGLNSFNREYKGKEGQLVPDLADVETGGGGLPSSPYSPNLTSPGPGSIKIGRAHV